MTLLGNPRASETGRGAIKPQARRLALLGRSQSDASISSSSGQSDAVGSTATRRLGRLMASHMHASSMSTGTMPRGSCSCSSSSSSSSPKPRNSRVRSGGWEATNCQKADQRLSSSGATPFSGRVSRLRAGEVHGLPELRHAGLSHVEFQCQPPQAAHPAALRKCVHASTLGIGVEPLKLAELRQSGRWRWAKIQVAECQASEARQRSQQGIHLSCLRGKFAKHHCLHVISGRKAQVLLRGCALSRLPAHMHTPVCRPQSALTRHLREGGHMSAVGRLPQESSRLASCDMEARAGMPPMAAGPRSKPRRRLRRLLCGTCCSREQ